MAISFIADSPWSSNSVNSSYTLPKPTGTANGDYMIAIVAIGTFNSGGGSTTITPPTGWTLRGTKYSSPNLVIGAFTRVAGASEPSSWTGSLSTSDGPKASIVATYRGVATSNGIANGGLTSAGSTTSFSTSTVNNPASTNWRVILAGYTSSTVSHQIESNEVVNRERAWFDTVEVGVWDSNGTISAGNTSRTVSRGAIWESAAAWIAILDNQEGAAVSGTFAATLPSVSMSVAANINYSGTLAATLPTLAMVGDGIASPPEGPLEVAITPVMAGVAATDAVGLLDVLAVPVVTILGETRKFGIRVTTVEGENRRIVPLLGSDTVPPERLMGRLTQAAAGGDVLRVQIPMLRASFAE